MYVVHHGTAVWRSAAVSSAVYTHSVIIPIVIWLIQFAYPMWAASESAALLLQMLPRDRTKADERGRWQPPGHPVAYAVYALVHLWLIRLGFLVSVNFIYRHKGFSNKALDGAYEVIVIIMLSVVLWVSSPLLPKRAPPPQL